LHLIRNIDGRALVPFAKRDRALIIGDRALGTNDVRKGHRGKEERARDKEAFHAGLSTLRENATGL
jgi:hypothetical protein